MEKYKAAIYIGRFQPFHTGHLNTLKHALEIAEKVLVVIGSSHAARDTKNPFTFQERKQMILACLPDQAENLLFEPQRDYHYDESQWRIEITERIKKYFKLTDALALVGVYKDDSSYYLNQFPFLEFVTPTESADKVLHATDTRKQLFTNPNCTRAGWSDKDLFPATLSWKTNLHPRVSDWIEANFLKTKEFERLEKEYVAIENYKKQWSSSPYPPSFMTSDVVLRSANNILVVRRKLGIGKGLLALPGGFVRSTETTKQAAIRELREETAIQISPEKLSTLLKDNHIFDFPKRSLRGRTITNAFYGVLPKEGEDLQSVSGGDDAAEAFWLPVFEVYERADEFFEDHFHIIHYFLTKEK